jgi:hypothetical protein
MVWKSVCQPDKQLRQNGDIVRSEGDVYLVECAVTGTDVGAERIPKSLYSICFATLSSHKLKNRFVHEDTLLDTCP